MPLAIELKLTMNLDCETHESVEQSLVEILRIDRSHLQNQITQLAEGNFEVNEDIVSDRWLPMLNAVAGRVIEDADCGQTHWFHATRVKDLNSFRGGIRSLPLQLNETWASLYSLVADCVSPEEWREFRRETERDNFGGHSPDVIKAWMSNEGPYAFLFAESSLSPGKIGNHDYLATSELLEFISICFERKYRVSLHDRHHAATQPTLVKFTTKGLKAFHLGAALDYLLHRANGWSLSCLSPCFSGEGRSVAPEQMVKAIPVLENTKRFGKYASYTLSSPSCHVPFRA